MLCTVDLVALYPSVPHGKGLEAIREALNRRENPTVASDTLVELASVVLENFFFEFNDRSYRQKRDVIGKRGTKFAPTCANLFIARLEEMLLEESTDKLLVWMRFTDVFFI